MTDTAQLPPHTITINDHPEPHIMQWSDLELAAIKKYAESYALQARAQVQGEPFAWVEHHKGGDNLVWDEPGGRKSPLYTTPQPSQATQAEVTDEPYGWAVTGCHSLYRGEWAEDTARSEAKRCGGTARAFPVYTHPDPNGLQWFTVDEHGIPEVGEAVIGGLWYTDPWLKPDRATYFMWGQCSVIAEKHRDFKEGKRWLTFGPSHNQITHWARLTPPAMLTAAQEPS